MSKYQNSKNKYRDKNINQSADINLLLFRNLLPIVFSA